MTHGWIDKDITPPQEDAGTIIVWGEGWPSGVVAAMFDYGEWLDVVDRCNVTFRWWMPAPLKPEGV